MSSAGANADIAPVAFATADDLDRACAARIAGQLQVALRDRGVATLLVAGGSTPAPMFRRLAQADLDWPKVTVAQVDERFVSPSSPLSNARMIRETLLMGPAAAARFLPLWSDTADLQAAADAADGVMATLPRPWDGAVLGMGEDGHFASLFPGSPQLAAGLSPDTDRLCLAIPPHIPAPKEPRLSLTLNALLETRHIVLMIRGEKKRVVVEAARAGNDALPIHAILAQTRAPVSVLWSPEA
jgi:6-phosphogluconolactonase